MQRCTSMDDWRFISKEQIPLESMVSEDVSKLHLNYEPGARPGDQWMNEVVFFTPTLLPCQLIIHKIRNSCS